MLFPAPEDVLFAMEVNVRKSRSNSHPCKCVECGKGLWANEVFGIHEEEALCFDCFKANGPVTSNSSAQRAYDRLVGDEPTPDWSEARPLLVKILEYANTRVAHAEEWTDLDRQVMKYLGWMFQQKIVDQDRHMQLEALKRGGLLKDLPDGTSLMAFPDTHPAFKDGPPDRETIRRMIAEKMGVPVESIQLGEQVDANIGGMEGTITMGKITNGEPEDDSGAVGRFTLDQLNDFKRKRNDGNNRVN
jgi:hypothetical protein